MESTIENNTIYIEPPLWLIDNMAHIILKYINFIYIQYVFIQSIVLIFHELLL